MNSWENFRGSPGILEKFLRIFWRYFRRTPGRISEEYLENSRETIERILRQLLEWFPRNSWWNFRGTSVGIPENLLEVFSKIFWRNCRWSPGRILEGHLEVFPSNSLRNSQGTPVGVPNEHQRKFPRDFLKNSRVVFVNFVNIYCWGTFWWISEVNFVEITEGCGRIDWLLRSHQNPCYYGGNFRIIHAVISKEILDGFYHKCYRKSRVASKGIPVIFIGKPWRDSREIF